MSVLLRCSLVLLETFCNHAACTPPNKTPSKGRYQTEGILQMAPLIFKIHNICLWLSTTYEVLSTLIHYYGPSLSPSLSTHLGSTLCLAHRMENPHSYTLTPTFLLGVSLVVLGSYIRVRCFNELGKFFTFDLTIHPEHKLVRTGAYGFVRHPSYTGSLILIVGIALSHLTPGSWAWGCGVIGFGRSVVLWVVWLGWSMAVAVDRAYKEDSELRKTFLEEWDRYAAEVRYWFIPGLL